MTTVNSGRVDLFILSLSLALSLLVRVTRPGLVWSLLCLSCVFLTKIKRQWQWEEHRLEAQVANFSVGVFSRGGKQNGIKQNTKHKTAATRAGGGWRRVWRGAGGELFSFLFFIEAAAATACTSDRWEALCWCAN